ncbi:hypothetical protein RHSIM_Rhsim06G0076600 [Rhododendron simsii]|uniref:Uncharacterized protein n=1 Tax=Rhododendron simsii TaxID=118357 RepID=A0A834GXX8_RHOSS|nr:hypothetical protein RHSIM_Rhsim06G0076600 [Rhododendron simsii]
MRGEPLLLSDIYPQWRIDIRSFTMDGGMNTNGSDIESLLKKYHDKHKCMPLCEREDSQKQIAQLINAEIPLTLEPTIQPHKADHQVPKKEREIALPPVILQLLRLWKRQENVVFATMLDIIEALANDENRFFWSHLRGFIFNYLMEVSLIIMVKEKDV